MAQGNVVVNGSEGIFSFDETVGNEVVIGSYLEGRFNFIKRLGDMAENSGPVTGELEGVLYTVNSRQHAKELNDAFDGKVRQEGISWMAKQQEVELAQAARISALPKPLQHHASTVNPARIADDLPRWEDAARIAEVCKTVENVEKYLNMSYSEQEAMVQLKAGHSNSSFAFTCELARMVCNGGYEST